MDRAEIYRRAAAGQYQRRYPALGRTLRRGGVGFQVGLGGDAAFGGPPQFGGPVPFAPPAGVGGPGFPVGGPPQTPGLPDPSLMRGGFGETPTDQSPAGGGPLRAIGRFISKNPEVVSSLAGTAADIYGSVREGNARDREIAETQRANRAREEEIRKQREDDRVRMLLQVMASMQPRY